MSAYEAAVRAMAAALYPNWQDGEIALMYAEAAFAAFAANPDVRAALVDVGSTALVQDWNHRPYVGQTAYEDTATVVDAILAALRPPEAPDA